MKLKIGYVMWKKETKNYFFKIWAACRCEISFETAKLRNFNTLKVLKPFSQADILILLILTDIAGSDSKFTLVRYGEIHLLLLFDFEAFLRSRPHRACLPRARLNERYSTRIRPMIFVTILQVSTYNIF
jgi:hypothetical protein